MLRGSGALSSADNGHQLRRSFYFADTFSLLELLIDDKYYFRRDSHLFICFSAEEKFLIYEDLHTFASVDCHLITLQGKGIVTSCGRKVICIKRLFAPEPVYK